MEEKLVIWSQVFSVVFIYKMYTSLDFLNRGGQKLYTGNFLLQTPVPCPKEQLSWASRLSWNLGSHSMNTTHGHVFWEIN